MGDYVCVRKRILFMLVCILTVCVLGGCARSTDREGEVQRYRFVSRTTKELCYLCSESGESPLAPYGHHANIGIVNVNTFEVMELDINRYDWDGNLIMQATGTMHMCGSALGGIYVTGSVDSDCSFASVSFNPKGEEINKEKIGQFLCQDCLDAFASDCHGGNNISPICVVNFKHRYLVPLHDTMPWFYRKDYLVTTDHREDGSIGVVAVYNPPRFRENGQLLDEGA